MAGEATYLSSWESIAVIASTVISLVALARTINWKKPEIYLHDLKGLIVGFTRFGPLFTFRGTLESKNRDSLVSLIKIVIVRNRDKAEHDFMWHLWEPPVISKDPLPLTMASAFLLAEKQTVSSFLTLQDEQTQRQFEGKLVQLRSKFENYLIDNKLLPNPATTPPDWPALFKQFSDSEQKNSTQDNLPVEIHTLLQRMMYWEAGKYSATIEVHTTHPDSIQKFRFEFSLSDLDHQNLSNNLIAIMWDACSIPGINYNTARPAVENYKRLT